MLKRLPAFQDTRLAVAERAPMRRFGIKAKMGIAFAVVAAMAVASGMVAWVSFRRIESDLTTVVGKAVPATVTAEALAVETAAIVNATGSLTAALTEVQRLQLMTTLAARVAGLHDRLDELRRFDVDDVLIANLRDRISSLANNLRSQSDLVAQRIALGTHVQADAAQLGESHKQFLNAVRPHIDETYRSLFAGIKTLVDDLRQTRPASPAEPPPVAAAGDAPRPGPSHQDMVVLQRRIAWLFNRNVGEMLALLELAAAGNLAAGLLNEVVLVTDPGQVQQLRNRFSEITVSMGTIRLNLASTAENQMLLGRITPMLQYGLGADNQFDRRLHELELVQASNAVVAENGRQAEALATEVDRLLGSARSRAEQLAHDVQGDAAYARLLQSLAAGMAVLVALGIGWLYFGRGVIGRLLALQRAMEGEAAGREIVIPADGNDEIADMAGALRHFVERRKQAEVDLRAAKERAEGAFAELKDVQQTLVQTEKMAALGGLVAGVAHELNTPVGVCLTASSLLAERIDELARNFESGQLRKSKVQDFIDVAAEVTILLRNNLERSGNLIRVFKQVATEPNEDERQIFRVLEHLEISISLITEAGRFKPSSIVLDCPPDLTINGFPEALRQVVTVMIDNALTHAFPDGCVGTVTVSAAPLDASAIVLTVADTGIGIDAADQARLFEPFFTTRRGQGGIGLGLHMAFNVVASVLGGRIQVESTPGRGSSFIVTLPVTSPATVTRRRG
ncbi:MAG: ATP-binding protein [Rhodospirillaceae bacterium]